MKLLEYLQKLVNPKLPTRHKMMFEMCISLYANYFLHDNSMELVTRVYLHPIRDNHIVIRHKGLDYEFYLDTKNKWQNYQAPHLKLATPSKVLFAKMLMLLKSDIQKKTLDLIVLTSGMSQRGA